MGRVGEGVCCRGGAAEGVHQAPGGSGGGGFTAGRGFGVVNPAKFWGFQATNTLLCSRGSGGHILSRGRVRACWSQESWCKSFGREIVKTLEPTAQELGSHAVSHAGPGDAGAGKPGRVSWPWGGILLAQGGSSRTASGVANQDLGWQALAVCSGFVKGRCWVCYINQPWHELGRAAWRCVNGAPWLTSTLANPSMAGCGGAQKFSC